MGEASFDFAGRRVLVTGGTRGLGLTVARAFARSGAHVTITGTQTLTSSYDAAVAGFDYLRLELTDHDSIVRVAEQTGAVDVLVNTAGARIPRSAEHDREFIAHSVALGLIGPTQLTRRLRYRLGESTMRGGGAVVNTHHLRRWFELAHGPAGAGDEMLEHTSRLGANWSPSGIRVNAVASTVTVPRQSTLRVQIERHSGPLLTRPRPQRSGTLQDVASAVLFLASGAAAYITGQTLMVNGSGNGGARLDH